MSDISEQGLRAAEAIVAAPAAQVAETLREALQQFVSSEFGIASAAVVDGAGGKTHQYSAVIYRKDSEESAEHPEEIPADRVAVVVEAYDEVDAGRLCEAYARIAAVKRLTKTPVPRGETRTNVILGVVFAPNSSVSLDVLADQLYQLDLRTPHQQWLDMVVVASVGVINYALQFPGEGLAGDFMPPAEGAFESPAPPAFYVTVVMRPTGEGSFNKLVAFIAGHLIFFAPDVANKQIDWNSMLDGQPTGVITTFGFQPNLRGQLVPVPPEGYSGKFIPNRPVQIEGPHGKVLGALQFMQWQTGGVILMVGRLPLEGLLIFLPDFKPEYLRVVKRPTYQISPVLPISQLEFSHFLSNLQLRTNFRIREETGAVVMEKFLDEGTTTPFVARCTLGLLRIRENVLADGARRQDFDKRFESVLSSVMTARKKCRALLEIWTNHRERVTLGEAARLEGRDIRVFESVNKQLGDEFESFLNAATRAIKIGVQGLCSFLGAEIGFLFKKQPAFEAGIERLRRTDAALADYLVETRRWTERLVFLRNSLEHEVWQFPKVVYSAGNGSLHATEPEISGDRLTVLVEFLLDRTLCFFEEMTVHALQRHLPDGSTITEIARNLRAKEAPERFRITLALGASRHGRSRTIPLDLMTPKMTPKERDGTEALNKKNPQARCNPGF